MTTPIDLRIIVPFHGHPELLGDCLESIVAQDYATHGGFFEVMVVDDDSPPSDLHAPERGLDNPAFQPLRASPRLTWGVSCRGERGGELASIMTGTRALERENCRPFPGIPPLTAQSVIVHVCGDDWLAGPDSLRRLAEHYQDPETWMTYGSYTHEDGSPGPCEALPPEAHELGDYRARPWVTSHLRSYRLGLWRMIPREQLIDPETDRPWFYGTDLAMMFPMLEMARERARFIPEALYRYRRHAGNVPPEAYAGPCERVRALTRLQRIESL